MMKSKKLVLPFIIILVAIVAMVAGSLLSNIAKKPTITEKKFDFSITYELNGETVTLEDSITARYVTNGGYNDTKTRIYTGKIGTLQDNDTTDYILQSNAEGRIVLDTKLYADYLMGDPEYDYFSDDTFEPQLYYYDAEETEYTDEETLLSKGVKLVSWEYPTPIENTFVFSHISIFSGQVAFLTLFIGLLALVAILIFVKKEEGFVCKPIDRVSTVFNFIIGFTAVPFFALASWLADITGDNEHLTNQMFYFTSAFSVLCIGASISLRRKGFGKSALIVQFAGPAAFLLIYLASML